MTDGSRFLKVCRTPELACELALNPLRRLDPVASHRVVLALVLMALLPMGAEPARAWIFPEHRKITSTAISGLDPQQAEILGSLWQSARTGREGRFCLDLNEADQEGTPVCLPFAAWPAIAGDHSCSFKEMLATVSDADWILKVAAIGARTARDLAAATNQRKADSAYVRYTLDLARTDPAPGVRGAANNGHFSLNRESNDPLEYIASTVRGGAPLNAIGIYASNHLAALRLATAWGAGNLAPREKDDLARAALAREAFGLHFLEDAFAAGHVAGCWGRAAERLGTHDYYNEHGLETMTWAGKNAILLGDRHMRPEDLDRVASAVQASLAQLLSATRPDSALAAAVSSLPLEKAREHPAFNVCKETVFQNDEVPESLYPVLQEVIAGSPMPGRGPGIASLPRSRAEVGPFISWVSGARVGVLDGSFEPDLDGLFVDGEVSLGVRFGVGLDGLTGRNADGLMFLEVGVANRQEKGPYYSSADATENNPGRTGVQFRLRSPFWLIPGDLILAGPVLYFTSPQKFKSMAIVAANGGLVPWQRPMPFGEQKRFQFILGREVGLSLHGQWGSDHFMMRVRATPESSPEMHEVEIRTVEWEFPIIEYRAFRTFASRQSYTAVMQLGAGFDRPTAVEVIGLPDAPTPDLQTRRYIFMRVTIDVRHYF